MPQLNKHDVNHSVFAQYLLHKLKGLVKWEHENKSYKVELYGILQDDLQIENPYGGFDYCNYEDFKPVLKPMCDLEGFSPAIYMWLKNKCEGYVNRLQWVDFKVLLENHFDVFGLIEKGLAISIHDVE